MNKKTKNAYTKRKRWIFMDKKNEKKKNKKENIMDLSSVEVGEDATKYGEFISSYFAWVSLPEQKAKANRMENMTENKGNKK